jgi:ankyrin repeat protein
MRYPHLEETTKNDYPFLKLMMPIDYGVSNGKIAVGTSNTCKSDFVFKASLDPDCQQRVQNILKQYIDKKAKKITTLLKTPQNLNAEFVKEIEYRSQAMDYREQIDGILKENNWGETYVQNHYKTGLPPEYSQLIKENPHIGAINLRSDHPHLGGNDHQDEFLLMKDYYTCTFDESFHTKMKEWFSEDYLKQLEGIKTVSDIWRAEFEEGLKKSLTGKEVNIKSALEYIIEKFKNQEETNPRDIIDDAIQNKYKSESENLEEHVRNYLKCIYEDDFLEEEACTALMFLLKNAIDFIDLEKEPEFTIHHDTIKKYSVMTRVCSSEKDFDSVFKNDTPGARLSLAVQVLIGIMNIYLISKGKIHAETNIGKNFSKNKASVENLKKYFQDKRIINLNNFAKSIIEWMSEQSTIIGIKPEDKINEEDKKNILDNFEFSFSALIESPHWDEFIFCINNIENQFLYQNGLISIDFNHLYQHGFKKKVNHSTSYPGQFNMISDAAGDLLDLTKPENKERFVSFLQKIDNQLAIEILDYFIFDKNNHAIFFENDKEKKIDFRFIYFVTKLRRLGEQTDHILASVLDKVEFKDEYKKLVGFNLPFDLNANDSKGRTPVMYAAMSHNLSFILDIYGEYNEINPDPCTGVLELIFSDTYKSLLTPNSSEVFTASCAMDIDKENGEFNESLYDFIHDKGNAEQAAILVKKSIAKKNRKALDYFLDIKENPLNKHNYYNIKRQVIEAVLPYLIEEGFKDDIGSYCLEKMIQLLSEINKTDSSHLEGLRSLFAQHRIKPFDFINKIIEAGDQSNSGNTLYQLLSVGMTCEPARFISRHLKTTLTPLMKAAAKGQVELMKLFIANDAIIDAKDNDGLTPLMHAIINEHLDAVILLLKNMKKTPIYQRRIDYTDIRDSENKRVLEVDHKGLNIVDYANQHYKNKEQQLETSEKKTGALKKELIEAGHLIKILTSFIRFRDIETDYPPHRKADEIYHLITTNKDLFLHGEYSSRAIDTGEFHTSLGTMQEKHEGFLTAVFFPQAEDNIANRMTMNIMLYAVHHKNTKLVKWFLDQNILASESHHKSIGIERPEISSSGEKATEDVPSLNKFHRDSLSSAIRSNDKELFELLISHKNININNMSVENIKIMIIKITEKNILPHFGKNIDWLTDLIKKLEHDEDDHIFKLIERLAVNSIRHVKKRGSVFHANDDIPEKYTYVIGLLVKHIKKIETLDKFESSRFEIMRILYDLFSLNNILSITYIHHKYNHKYNFSSITNALTCINMEIKDANNNSLLSHAAITNNKDLFFLCLSVGGSLNMIESKNKDHKSVEELITRESEIERILNVLKSNMKELTLDKFKNYQSYYQDLYLCKFFLFSALKQERDDIVNWICKKILSDHPYCRRQWLDGFQYIQNENHKEILICALARQKQNQKKTNPLKKFILNQLNLTKKSLSFSEITSALKNRNKLDDLSNFLTIYFNTINPQDIINTPNEDGITPLTKALYLADEETVILLLSHGCHIIDDNTDINKFKKGEKRHSIAIKIQKTKQAFSFLSTKEAPSSSSNSPIGQSNSPIGEFAFYTFLECDYNQIYPMSRCCLSDEPGRSFTLIDIAIKTNDVSALEFLFNKNKEFKGEKFITEEHVLSSMEDHHFDLAISLLEKNPSLLCSTKITSKALSIMDTMDTLSLPNTIMPTILKLIQMGAYFPDRRYDEQQKEVIISKPFTEKKALQNFLSPEWLGLDHYTYSLESMNYFLSFKNKNGLTLLMRLASFDKKGYEELTKNPSIDQDSIYDTIAEYAKALITFYTEEKNARHNKNSGLKVTDKSGKTALYYAVYNGHIELVDLFLETLREKGDHEYIQQQINSYNIDSNLIVAAAKSKYTESQELLNKFISLSRQATPPSFPTKTIAKEILQTAFYYDDIQIMNFVLGGILEKDKTIIATETRFNNKTLFYMAIEHHHTKTTDCINELMRNDTSLIKIDPKGCTILNHALTINSNVDVIKLILFYLKKRHVKKRTVEYQENPRPSKKRRSGLFSRPAESSSGAGSSSSHAQLLAANHQRNSSEIDGYRQTIKKAIDKALDTFQPSEKTNRSKALYLLFKEAIYWRCGQSRQSIGIAQLDHYLWNRNKTEKTTALNNLLRRFNNDVRAAIRKRKDKAQKPNSSKRPRLPSFTEI